MTPIPLSPKPKHNQISSVVSLSFFAFVRRLLGLNCMEGLTVPSLFGAKLTIPIFGDGKAEDVKLAAIFVSKYFGNNQDDIAAKLPPPEILFHNPNYENLAKLLSDINGAKLGCLKHLNQVARDLLKEVEKSPIGWEYEFLRFFVELTKNSKFGSWDDLLNEQKAKDLDSFDLTHFCLGVLEKLFIEIGSALGPDNKLKSTKLEAALARWKSEKSAEKSAGQEINSKDLVTLGEGDKLILPEYSLKICWLILLHRGKYDDVLYDFMSQLETKNSNPEAATNSKATTTAKNFKTRAHTKSKTTATKKSNLANDSIYTPRSVLENFAATISWNSAGDIERIVTTIPRSCIVGRFVCLVKEEYDTESCLYDLGHGVDRALECRDSSKKMANEIRNLIRLIGSRILKEMDFFCQENFWEVEYIISFFEFLENQQDEPLERILGNLRRTHPPTYHWTKFCLAIIHRMKSDLQFALEKLGTNKAWEVASQFWNEFSEWELFGSHLDDVWCNLKRKKADANLLSTNLDVITQRSSGKE